MDYSRCCHLIVVMGFMLFPDNPSPCITNQSRYSKPLNRWQPRQAHRRWRIADSRDGHSGEQTGDRSFASNRLSTADWISQRKHTELGDSQNWPGAEASQTGRPGMLTGQLSKNTLRIKLEFIPTWSQRYCKGNIPSQGREQSMKYISVLFKRAIWFCGCPLRLQLGSSTCYNHHSSDMVLDINSHIEQATKESDKLSRDVFIS